MYTYGLSRTEVDMLYKLILWEQYFLECFKIINYPRTNYPAHLDNILVTVLILSSLHWWWLSSLSSVSISAWKMLCGLGTLSFCQKIKCQHHVMDTEKAILVKMPCLPCDPIFWVGKGKKHFFYLIYWTPDTYSNYCKCNTQCRGMWEW